MKPSLDRALRIVWLAIGVLLLASLAAALLFVAAGFLRTRTAPDEAARAAGDAVAPPSGPLRPGRAVDVAGTATRLVPVVHGGGHAPGLAAPGRIEGLANVVFLDPDGGARLLLDRPALVRTLWHPTEEGAGQGPWIAYEIAFGGGAAPGPPGLYVSDLDGTNLRPVIRPPLRYRSHQPWSEGRILVVAADESGAPRTFLYDVAEGRLTPFAALDSAVAEAAGIVER